jgi:hypothetical protein
MCEAPGTFNGDAFVATTWHHGAEAYVAYRLMTIILALLRISS